MTLAVGGTAFGLMLPILGGYIAYSIAGKPGLVAGMIGGYLSGHLRIPWDDNSKEVGAPGFAHALVAGLVAGYLVLFMKHPTAKFVKPIMPILIIPVISSVAIATLMLLVVGPPIAAALLGLQPSLGTWPPPIRSSSRQSWAR